MRILPFLMILFSAIPALSQTAATVELYFSSGSPALGLKTRHSIDSLLQAVSKEEITSIKISGHCDEEGSSLKNLSLSVKRARAVYDYLNQKGIRKSIMTYKGYGATHPKYSNAAGKSKNRRTELVITAKTIEKKPPPPPVPAPVTRAPAAPAPVKRAPAVSPTRINNFNRDSLVVGKTIQLKNLNFYPGQARLLPSALPSLDELVRLMKQNPAMEIEIDGHVCCENAQKMSVARAFEVYSRLIENGIKEDRLSYKGFSNSRPLVEEKTEEDRIKNRRVEIKVLKK